MVFIFASLQGSLKLAQEGLGNELEIIKSLPQDLYSRWAVRLDAQMDLCLRGVWDGITTKVNVRARWLADLLEGAVLPHNYMAKGIP